MKEGKIKQFTVIERGSKEEFVTKVNELLKEGWQPYSGTVLPSQVGAFMIYAQAMVKYE